MVDLTTYQLIMNFVCLSLIGWVTVCMYVCINVHVLLFSCFFMNYLYMHILC